MQMAHSTYSQVHLIIKRVKGQKYQIIGQFLYLLLFSKIFEKVILNRLHIYISVSNILDADQYGFRKNCSTGTVTFIFTSNTLQALDSKKLVAEIFCDLTTGFDSEMLLAKLKFHGLQGIFLKLTAS
jgi:hypothetical protein